MELICSNQTHIPKHVSLIVPSCIWACYLLCTIKKSTIALYNATERLGIPETPLKVTWIIEVTRGGYYLFTLAILIQILKTYLVLYIKNMGGCYWRTWFCETYMKVKCWYKMLIWNFNKNILIHSQNNSYFRANSVTSGVFLASPKIVVLIPRW